MGKYLSRLLLALAFFAPVAVFAQQPQAANTPPVAPIFDVNAKFIQGVAIGYAPTAGSGLTLNLGPGTSFCAGAIVNYGPTSGTLTMANSVTNYVYLDGSGGCVPAVSTSIFTCSTFPIAIVPASGGVITSITDVRTLFQSGCGGSAFGPPPTSPNITFFPCDVVSGGIPTLTYCKPGMAGRTVTGTSDTILSTDRGRCMLYTNGGAVAVAAPQVGVGDFQNNFDFCGKTATTTTLTITPTTSQIAANNGTLGSNIGVPASSTFYCYSWDNSTIQCTIVSPPSGSSIWQACNSRGFQSLSGAIPAGTVSQFSCVNDTGSTVTLTGIRAYCPTGSTTVNAANNAGTALLTGPVTCNSTKASGGAAGTQSGTTTLPNGDAITWTVVFDGVSDQINFNASGTF
jgi:hypothetical protein